MPGPFILDFFVFVFISALGVLQMVAAQNRLWGLLFIRRRTIAFLVGFGSTTLAFLWFFLSEPRNLSDTHGGLDGNGAAGIFTIASASALALTLVISSIRNRSMGKGDRRYAVGLDALRETTYLRALLGTVKVLWKRS